MDSRQGQTHIIEKLDKNSFEILFKQYFSVLCQFARKYVRDLDTSKEIVHDCFVSFWDKRDTIDLSKPVKTYLFTSVHNRCLNHIRNNKKFDQNVENFELLDLSHHHIASDSLVEQEISSQINNAIESLPEKCKEIFKMSRFEEMKYKEIAEKLNLSIKTVEAQMSKALQVMRTSLSEFISVLIYFIIFLTK
ncbi:MAG: hypothetical protein A2033_04625 [Bacteroidetes bacterium GWA2_31_9]|nr:MAG: hypothetical protein A2033_04625 [Bacteroidetes bacterium GWA2_31_9]